MLLSHAFKQLFTMYRKIEEKANMDRRTGLYNHSYFENALETELNIARSQNTPLSLALIDIDDFKKYNDHFGHLKGDQLLGFLGEILKKETSGTNIIVSRYGGEEFTLLMPDHTAEQAYETVNAIRKRLNDSRYEGVEIFPTAACPSPQALHKAASTSTTDHSWSIWQIKRCTTPRSRGKISFTHMAV